MSPPRRSNTPILRQKQRKLQSLAAPDIEAERDLLFAAASAKRRLFFREPDLEPLKSLLFVKRHAFEPSHNYSVILDSHAGAPAGASAASIFRKADGRFVPEEATCTKLFESADGIARNPMADFDVNQYLLRLSAPARPGISTSCG